MSIKELIKKLQEYKYKSAKVIITVGNEDDDTISTSDFECFQDTSDSGYVELFINEETCSRQI